MARLRALHARKSLTHIGWTARDALAGALLQGGRPVMAPVSDGDSELYRAVIAYLDEHPEAMDTLEGIAEWWVMRQSIRNTVTNVAFVVRQLVDEGLLEEVGPRERPCFRLRRGGRGH